MANATQTTVFGETLDEAYRIETTGRVIRPFKQLIGQVISPGRKAAEFKPTLGAGGLTTLVTDPANVIMVDGTIPAGTFDGYDVPEEIQLGVTDDLLGSLFQHARYGVSTDDDLTITGNSRRMETKVTRDLHGVTTTFRERRGLIDPDSIREQPDFPDVDYAVKADIPVRTFIEVIDAVDADYARIEATDAGLAVSSETDVSQMHVGLDMPVESDGDAAALYSTDYLDSIAKALHVGKVDDMTLRFSDEFPMVVEFDREDTYHGRIMLAPRIKDSE